MSNKTTIADETGSAFAANVPGAWSLRRRFFLEVDPLPFIELVEASLDRTAMKEPFLPAIVANETESPVTNESLDCAARHPSLLERTGAQRDPNIKFRSSGAFLRIWPKYGRARRLIKDDV